VGYIKRRTSNPKVLPS